MNISPRKIWGLFNWEDDMATDYGLTASEKRQLMEQQYRAQVVRRGMQRRYSAPDPHELAYSRKKLEHHHPDVHKVANSTRFVDWLRYIGVDRNSLFWPENVNNAIDILDRYKKEYTEYDPRGDRYRPQSIPPGAIAGGLVGGLASTPEGADALRYLQGFAKDHAIPRKVEPEWKCVRGKWTIDSPIQQYLQSKIDKWLAGVLN